MVKRSPTRRFRLIFSRFTPLLFLLGSFVFGFAGNFAPRPALASAAGINQTINFQGRLLSNVGAVVADGTYNMRFKIYQDGDGLSTGDSTGSPTGAIKWQELWQMSVASGTSSGVVVKNGYFSVNLGSYCGLATNATCQGTSNSGVNFNWDTLWLSMDVGGTTVTNTPTYDGEMLPMKRLGSAVYALQAASANTCSGCILQAPTSTAQNTINPGSSNAVGLTIQASSNGANPDLLGLNNSGGTAVAKIDRTGNIFAPSIDAFGTTLTLGGANATGTVSVATAASGINLGHSGITTSNLGALTVSENLAANGNTTIGNATSDRLTVTSQLLGQDALVFQGATDDSFTTTLRIADPTTPSKIITLPNETGTICTTGSVCTGYAPASGGSYAKQDLSNLASVAINAPLNFASTGTGSIGFISAAAAAGNALTITGQTATSGNGGAVTVQGGVPSGTNNGGLLSLLGGVPVSTSGTNGGVTIDTGNFAGSVAGTIAVGNSAFPHTIQVGTGAAIQALTLGSTNSTSSTIVQGGTASNSILLQTASAGGISLAPGSGGLTTTLGDASQFAINATPTADTAQNSFKLTLNPTITGSTATLQGLLISQSDNANTGVYDSLAKIENLKTPETTTNGLFIEQNAASGTLANGLQVTNTAGAITNAINLTGTFTNLFNSPTLDISNAGAITGATGLVSSGTIQLSGLTTDGPVYTSGGNGTLNSEANLSVARGGSGAGTFSANAVLLGNGTSAFQVVAPGSNGNVLTSNGTTWTSAAPAAGCATCVAQVPTTTAQNTINPGANAGVIALTVRGGSSGSPRILEIRDSGNTVQGYFDSVGALTLAQTLTVPTVAFAGTGSNGVVNFLNAASTTAGALNVTGQTAGGTNAGGAINITGGTASGAAAGGLITLQGGAASATSGSNGGGVSILAANGTATSTGGAGGNVQITAGNGTSSGNNNGGNITLTAGSAGSGGSAVIGSTIVKNAANGTTAFQVQNAGGSAALTVDTTNLNALVSNGSFEAGTTGWAANGTGASIAQSTSEKYIGGASLDFTTGTAVGNSARLTVGTALSTSTTYTLSFYAKAGTAMSTLSASYSPDGSTGNESDCSIFNPSRSVTTTGWTRYYCTLNTSATSASASGFISIKQSDATSRHLFIDAVQIEAGSAITQALVGNVGFETNTTGWAYVGTPGSIARSTVDKYLGAASMLITTTANTNNGAKYTTANTNPTQLATSTTYTLSFWAKSTGTALTTLAAAYARNGSAETDCTLNSTTLTTTDWTYYYCTITTDSTAPAASAYVIIKNSAATVRTWYVDDVQLTKSSFVALGGAYRETGLALNGVISSPATFKNQSDSTTAFQIQNSSSSALFVADTTNWRLYVGPIAGDTVGALLVLGNKTDYTNHAQASEPTGVVGAMYYNSALGQFRCYEVDHWRDCLESVRTSYHYSNDFSSVQTDDTVTYDPNGSAGTIDTLSGEIGHPGIDVLGITTSASSPATMAGVVPNTAGNQLLRLGNGDYWRFETVTRGRTSTGGLSSATQRYVFRAGFHDLPTGGADATNGCYFRYSDNINSGKWQGVCRSASTESVCDTGFTPLADAWYRLTVSVNAAGTSADFAVNGGTTVSTNDCQVTSNIPTSAGTTWGVGIIKTVGATARAVDLDYVDVTGELGTAR